METKKIKILEKFSDKYKVGDVLSIEVNASGTPIDGMWRRFLADDLKYVGWYVEPVKPKTTKQKAKVDEIGEI